jgi:type II secretion system protein G
MMKGHKGFTLIELLIVVAIIAILAAIAIPNFLAAQTRSKVSKVKAEQQSIATALESYYVDNNIYPAPDEVPAGVGKASDDGNHDGQLPRALTTPVAFVSSLFKDPFKVNGKGIYEYGGGYPASPNAATVTNGTYFAWPGNGWIVSSYGPDVVDGYSSTKLLEESAWGDSAFGTNPRLDASPFTYDPTNGTTSGGDVWRRGP